MLFCHRCRHRSIDVYPIPTPDGEDKYACMDRAACNQRRKWAKMFKKKKNKV